MPILLIVKFGLEGMFLFDKPIIDNINEITELDNKYNNKIVILNKRVDINNLKEITNSILELRKKLNIITFCLWKGKGAFNNISSTEFLNEIFKHDKLFDESQLFLSLKFSNNVKNTCQQWKKFNSETFVEYHQELRVIDRFIKGNFRNEKQKEIKNFKLSNQQFILIQKIIRKINIMIET